LTLELRSRKAVWPRCSGLHKVSFNPVGNTVNTVVASVGPSQEISDEDITYRRPSAKKAVFSTGTLFRGIAVHFLIRVRLCSIQGKLEAYLGHRHLAII
jgi:hypothetical protein